MYYIEKASGAQDRSFPYQKNNALIMVHYQLLFG
jgi:hypothetical protein